MASEKFDPRYIYERYARNQLMSIEELNTFVRFFIQIGKKPSILTVIIFSVLMTGLLALFKIRQSMMEAELLLAKQGYERRRKDQNQSDLEGDDLD